MPYLGLPIPSSDDGDVHWRELDAERQARQLSQRLGPRPSAHRLVVPRVIGHCIELRPRRPLGVPLSASSGQGRTSGKTRKNVKGAWIKDQEVTLEIRQVSGYEVILKITDVLERFPDEGQLAPAACAMRRALRDGDTLRRCQLQASCTSWPQSPKRSLTNPSGALASPENRAEPA